MSDINILKNNELILEFYTGKRCMKFLFIIIMYILYFPGIHDWCVFKALHDLVESDLPCGPKFSKVNSFMTFFLRFVLIFTLKILRTGLKSTKELFPGTFIQL